MRRKSRPTAEKLLLKAVTQLAEVVSLDESAIDQIDYEQGRQVIEIYENPVIHASFERLKETKIEVFHQIIEDLSTGANKLKHRIYGIELVKNKLKTFSIAYGEPLPKNLVLTIGLTPQFQHQEDVDQTQLNLGIYTTVVHWGKFLRDLMTKSRAA